MTSFSASEAAFSGFRFIGRRPRTVLLWGLVILLYQLVSGGLWIALAADKLAELKTFTETNESDPGAALAMLPGLSLVLIIGCLGALALWSVLFAAAYRARLEPEADRFAYLRVGKDELLLAAWIVIWVALSMGYAFLLFFLLTTFLTLGAAFPYVLKLLYAALVGIAGAIAWAYPIVRLSFAMPMTLADQHVRMFESWHLTRGRFWLLFGTYLLTTIMMFVVFLVSWILIVAIGAVLLIATGGSTSDLSILWQPNTGSLAAHFSPVAILVAALNAAMAAGLLAIFTAPVSEAYLIFSGQAPEHAAEESE